MNYLIRRPGFGVLCKPPRPGMTVFWESAAVISQMYYPWQVGVMLFDSEDGAINAAQTYNGIATPITEVFDRSVILTPMDPYNNAPVKPKDPWQAVPVKNDRSKTR